jgi:hypothetical protein
MGSQEAPIDINIAIRPNDIDAVPGLIKELQAGLDGLASGGDAARHEMLIKARTLTQALETPRETMVKHCWAQVRTFPPMLLRLPASKRTRLTTWDM